MALVSSVIPNLIGGVSQQSPAARPRNASKHELNTIHSVVTGLNKRPPTDWVAEIFNDNDASVGASTHAFETANGKRFVLAIDKDTGANTRMTVVDVEDGTKYPISLAGVSDYFASTLGNLDQGFSFLTVGDTTFVLNRAVSPSEVPVSEGGGSQVVTDLTVTNFGDLPLAQNQNTGTTAYVSSSDAYYIVQQTVEEFALFGSHYVVVKSWNAFTPTAPLDRLSPAARATAYIRQAVHNTTYKLTVTFTDDTTAVGTYTTQDPETNGNANYIDTGIVATQLAASLSSHADVFTNINGSSIIITANKDIAKIEATDEFGDQAMRAYASAVQNFSDLPPNEAEGRVVRITGSVDTGGDDYYVEYVDGIWKETVAYGDRTELDQRTMPVTLTYDPGADSFAIAYHTWPGRTSGDKTSNPSPTFVGRTINDMFLFKGRLCFLADENVIFSEVGNYENFFRTTLTLLLETDPIDIASTAARTSILKYGVAFNETLVLFGDFQQFRIVSGNSLTPQNVSIVPTTTYNASPQCRPISVGANVFFAEDSPSDRYASIMEYYRNPNTEQDDAVNVTASVPKFIPKNVVKITSAFNENLVVVHDKANTGELYVYKYFWAGGEKAVSSWTTWKLENVTNVLSVDFFGDVLYIVARCEDGKVHLLSCNVEEGRYDDGLDFVFHVDMRVPTAGLTAVYSAIDDETTYTVPFDINASGMRPVLLVAADSGEYVVGQFLATAAASANTLTVPGDTTGLSVMFGFSYDMLYDFSPQYVRSSGGGGEIVRQNGRLSLRYMKLRFDNTASFRVEVTPEGRQTWIAKHPTAFYTNHKFNSEASVSDNVYIAPGEFRFSCKGKSDAINIRIVNDSPFPSAFTQAEWEAQYAPKTGFI